MFIFPNRSILFSETDTGGNGGGTPAPESTAKPSVEKTPAPTSAAPKESGRYVSDTEYQQLEQRASESAKLRQQIKEHGVKDDADLVAKLQLASRITSDDRLKSAIEVLTTEQNTKSDDDEGSKPLTQRDAEKLLMDSLKKYDSEKQQVEAKRQLVAAKKVEDDLFNEVVVGDTRLANVFGSHSFDDVLDGKAGEEAQTVAELVDSALYRAAPRGQNGSALPITDREAMKAAVDSVFGRLTKLKAHELLSAKRAADNQPGDGKIKGTLVGDEVTGIPNYAEHDRAAAQELRVGLQATSR